MRMPKQIDANLLAPCGVNCLACSAYLRAHDACPGCRATEELQKRKSCQNCAKKRCLDKTGLHWCFECERFPCTAINSQSKRYREKYGIDLVENSRRAARDLPAFLRAERNRFTCLLCGGVIDQHNRCCSECEAPAQR